MAYNDINKNKKPHKIDIIKSFMNHKRHSSHKPLFKPHKTTDQLEQSNKNCNTVFNNNSAKNSSSANNSDDSDNVRLKRKKKLLNNHGFSR